jgi:hypothetical protein
VKEGKRKKNIESRTSNLYPIATVALASAPVSHPVDIAAPDSEDEHVDGNSTLPTHHAWSFPLWVDFRHVKLGAKLIVISLWTWRLSIERRRRGQTRRIEWTHEALEGGTVSMANIRSVFRKREEENGWWRKKVGQWRIL